MLKEEKEKKKKEVEFCICGGEICFEKINIAEKNFAMTRNGFFVLGFMAKDLFFPSSNFFSKVVDIQYCNICGKEYSRKEV